MKRFIAAATLALAAVFAFGEVTAFAKAPYVGSKYGEAADSVRSHGQTPTIATVIGGLLPISDCIVTNSYMSMTLGSSGRQAHSGTRLFDLNCNLVLAQPGKPGGTAGTPAGQRAKQVERWIVAWNQKPEYCDGKAAFCQKACDQYGGCSAELLNYIGGSE